MRNEARIGHAPADWCTELPRAALEFAGFFGEYLDAINDKLDTFFGTLLQKSSGDSTAASALGASGAARFRDLGNTSMACFRAMTQDHRRTYVRLLRVVLTSPTAWLTGNAFRGHRDFKESMQQLGVQPGEADDYICRVGALLTLTTLGSFQVSTNKSGPRNFFFLKRVISADEHTVHFANILRAVGSQVADHKGHTLAHLREHKPKTAADPTFAAPPTAAEAAALVANLQALAA